MMELESMAVEMPEVVGHPNRVGFRGVLTVVDVPSQRAPSGAGGRRVVLTRMAAEAALPSLIGMALDYAPAYDRHDARRKVGVITSAEIVGRNLEVGGYLYAKDFPEVVEEVRKAGKVYARGIKIPTLAAKSAASVGHPAGMGHPPFLNRIRLPLPSLGAGNGDQGAIVGCKERAIRMRQARMNEGARLRTSLAAAVDGIRRFVERSRREKLVITGAAMDAASPAASGLGMSYEMTDVILADKRARMWTLIRVTFTGAAILRRDKAAYEDTWIELGR